MLAFLDVLIVIVPILLSVAFRTILERKVMGSMQRRRGPDTVGYYGILQPFADALKLILKESIMPKQAYSLLFVLGPVMSILAALRGWAIIPFAKGLSLMDFSLGLLFARAISSLSVYGILFAGWAANSKYAFLGSLRSASQRISYELLLSSAVLSVLFCSGSFDFNDVVMKQEAVPFVLPLLPIFIIYRISILAETNRTPFDLPEAESELTAGFRTEHSSLPFVLFFLAEYTSIVLRSASCALLFFSGPWLGSFVPRQSYLGGLFLGIKTSFFCFVFVWFRATLPRMRFDSLRTICWTEILPVVIALIVIIPCVIRAFDYA